MHQKTSEGKQIELILQSLGLSYTLCIKEDWPVFKTLVTGSTNDDAKAFILKAIRSGGLKHSILDGTVFWAMSQTKGRGRLGRSWSSQLGGLYCSIILLPNRPPETVPGISIVAGLSVAKAIRKTSSLPAQVKWPNDIYIGDNKVSGILSEAVKIEDNQFAVIVGIGINTKNPIETIPPEISNFTSLYEEFKRIRGPKVSSSLDTKTMLKTLLREFKINYSIFLQEGLHPIAEETNKMLAFLDCAVELRNKSRSDGEVTLGMLRGIDSKGRALIQMDDKSMIPFASGDLSLRKADHL
jgi:BirA family biotin operon repressor/biotin-[acetyl-CoA-carboxylase] ligase